MTAVQSRSTACCTSLRPREYRQPGRNRTVLQTRAKLHIDDKEKSGKKKNNDIIIVALASNATGTTMIKPDNSNFPTNKNK